MNHKTIAFILLLATFTLRADTIYNASVDSITPTSAVYSVRCEPTSNNVFTVRFATVATNNLTNVLAMAVSSQGTGVVWFTEVRLTNATHYAVVAGAMFDGKGWVFQTGDHKATQFDTQP